MSLKNVAGIVIQLLQHFFATFISAPQMNILDVVLVCSEEDLFVQYGQIKIKLLPEKAARLKDTGHNGRQVAMEVRAEDIFIYNEKASEQVVPIDTMVALSESMGAGTHFHIYHI